MNEAVRFAATGGGAFPAADALWNKRLVALGGGTGLSTLLRGLRTVCFQFADGDLPAAERERLTAIVTVADDGGSSGILRRAYPVLAPGDIRSCLLALAGSDSTLQALFDFRFNGDVDGHSLGNLILTALAQMESDFSQAVARAGEILDVRGRVLPATCDDVIIQAQFDDGSILRGESRITAVRGRIRHISLVPSHIRTLPQAVEAIEEADVIVIGPGSLYTSLVPTLLMPGIAEAIARSRARTILVMNLMTEPGETDGYSPGDIIKAIHCHTPELPVHYALINNAPIPEELAARYAAEAAVPVSPDRGEISDLGCKPVLRDLLGTDTKIRHDPDKLSRAIQELSA